MIKNKVIKVPVVDQIKDTGDDGWKEKTCGICSLKILMSFKDSKNLSIPVMDLVKQGLGLGAYIEEIGWKHAGLVAVAKRYGVDIDFQKIFPKNLDEKKKVMSLMNRSLNKGNPVMISVFWGFNPENGSHLVVVNGLRTENKKILGYHIQDPDHRFKGNNYFVSQKDFISGWRGGLLWLVK